MYYKVFDKKFFSRHQSILLWLLNAWLIKYWFRGVLHVYSSKKIFEITPNSYTFDKYITIRNGRLVTIQTTDFRTHNKYGKRLYFSFKYIWWTMHIWDEIFGDRVLYPRLSFGFDTLTKYPDAFPSSTTIDGLTEKNIGTLGVGVSWATLIGAAGTGDNQDAATHNYLQIISDNVSAQWLNIQRSLFLFDTSSLTANASISAATLSLFGNSKIDNLSVTPDINIYSSNPASNTTIVASTDHSQFGSTAFSTVITYANFSTIAYNDFTLNASGLTNISLTSISKFGARNANYDVAASSPTWSSNVTSQINGYYADQTGTANDPKLVITFTRTLALSQGAYTLTGQTITFLEKFWIRQTKNIASWIMGTKNSASWSNKTKNSSSWDNQTKN